MYDISVINGASGGLYKRLGWREPTHTGYTGVLDTDNKTSNSGRYFQDFCKLVTVRNIKETQPDKDITDGEFNTYLDNLQKAAILNVLNAIFSKQDLIEDVIVFPNENVTTYTVDNDSKFVGYEVNLAQRKDVAVQFKTLIGEFDGVATFDIYLFHSSDQGAVKTQSITTVTNEAKLQALTDWLLKYDSATIKGGKYYIGYFQDDLGSVKALNREWNDAATMNHSAMFGLRAISVTPNGTNLFDLDDITYESYTYGLNFDVSSYRDYTQLIVENVRVFDEAIGLQMAADVLELIHTSERTNRAEAKASEFLASAFNELYGSPDNENIPKSVGVMNMLNREIKKVRKILFKKEYKTVTAK